MALTMERMSCRGGACLAPALVSVSVGQEESSLWWKQSIGCQLSNVSFWPVDVHTTRIRVCTNSESQRATESIHDYNTLYVAHNTTRLPARRRDALSGSLRCPSHSFFATSSSITCAEPSKRQFALPWSRYHPMSIESSPAIGCSPSANPSADTIRRCTRKRCRGEAEPHARHVSMLPDLGQFTRPSSLTGSISSNCTRQGDQI